MTCSCFRFTYFFQIAVLATSAETARQRAAQTVLTTFVTQQTELVNRVANLDTTLAITRSVTRVRNE